MHLEGLEQRMLLVTRPIYQGIMDTDHFINIDDTIDVPCIVG